MGNGWNISIEKSYFFCLPFLKNFKTFLMILPFDTQPDDAEQKR